MAYDPGALEAALAAATSSVPDLIDDLRVAFFDSATAHVAALRAAESPEAWQAAALRLRSLAASFGAYRLIDAAQAAQQSEPHDRKVMTRIDRTLSSLQVGA